MELGVAISGYKEVIESAYDLTAISRAADFLSAMTYDYHGGWESTTAHHTPLVPSPKDQIPYYSIVSHIHICGEKVFLIGLINLTRFYTGICSESSDQWRRGPKEVAVGVVLLWTDIQAG